MQLAFIIWDIDPNIFSISDTIPIIGGFAIRWYGLLFALGFIFGYIILKKVFLKEGVPIKVLDDLATYMIIFTIIGARLGHCLFYEPAYYLSHPLDILKIWEGGLASHGAAVGILVGLYYFSKRYHKPYLWVLDRIVIVVALAGFFIRMGNLMNSEIFGEATTLPWGFVFVRVFGENYNIAHHPTQIYEALSYLILFVFLYSYYWKHKGAPLPGVIFGYFLVILFSVRFLIEFIKLPQVDFENNMLLNMGQILSIPFIFIGIYLIVKAYSSKNSQQKAIKL